jgi:hypothetical protein
MTGTGSVAMSASPTFTGTVGAVDVTTTGNTILGDASTDTLNVGNGGLVKDASGNVGIGTSSPLGKLNVSSASFGGTVSSNANQIVVENSGNAGITIASGATSLGNIFFADSGDTADGFVQYDQNGRYMRFGTATAERMRIDSSGNVGIGTATPLEKLSVHSAIGIRGSDFSSLSYFGSTVNTTGVYTGLDSGGGFVINVRDAGYQAFSTSNTERMRIDSNGALLVGTTTRMYAATMTVAAISSTYTYASIRGGTGSEGHLVFENGNGAVGTIFTSGTGTSYNTTSDYRLKENIAPMQGALDIISQLKPVTYNWKADGSDGQGFIAHELQAVVPDCVTGEKDAVNAEGKPLYQGIDVSFLVATLTAAIQELKAIVDAQAVRIAALEA